MPRLFVAIDLPSFFKKELSSLCYGVQGIRWVPAQNLHLTLRFIGEVPTNLYHEIREMLGSIELHPFELTTTHLDFFTGEKGPTTLWIGVEGSEDLLLLQNEIEKKIRFLGIQADKKKFKAHITLGRTENYFFGDLQPFFDQGMNLKKNTFEVTSFELFSSKLGGSSPHYLIEESYPLN